MKAKTGRIDILFANAGTAELAPLGAISEEHFDQIFDTNVKGVLFTVQKGAAADAGWRIDHPERVDRGLDRKPGVHRL